MRLSWEIDKIRCKAFINTFIIYFVLLIDFEGGYKMYKVGFIGLGIMGNPMAGHILNAGYPIFVYNRTRQKADNLIKKGAIFVDTPSLIAQHADIIITMVSDTKDVEEVLFGEDGVYEGIKPNDNKIVIDMSTISSEITKQFASKLKQIGCEMLDAPVSGGDIGAVNATLTIMVGGCINAYNTALPVLQKMGKTVTHLGPIGSGQACKMANQIMGAVNLIGLCEGMILASKEGLNLDKFLEVVSGGMAASTQLKINGPKIANRDFSAGFFTDLMVKDLNLVQSSQGGHNLFSPATSLAKQMLVATQAIGSGRDGMQAVIKAYEKLCNHTV